LLVCASRSPAGCDAKERPVGEARSAVPKLVTGTHTNVASVEAVDNGSD
jgi:hypothetical protein